MSKKSLKSKSTRVYGVYNTAILFVAAGSKGWLSHANLVTALDDSGVAPSRGAISSRIRELQRVKMIQVRRDVKDPRGSLQIRITGGGKKLVNGLKSLAA